MIIKLILGWFTLLVPFGLSMLPGTSILQRNQFQRLNTLPEKLLIAYASWNECDDKIIDAVRNGANVVMWFAINLLTDPVDGNPTITNGPNWDCVAKITNQLHKENLFVINMISVGGWNSPHPSTANSVEQVYNHWKKWNTETIARPDLGFYGFDGLDWDVEGNDDFTSPYNVFTAECLDLMGRFSQLAKQDGYVVSMAPCESYLDPTQPHFDYKVNHPYPEWDPVVPGFYYHGHNTYAYILNKYGETKLKSDEDGSSDDHGTVVETFDWIAMQIYEGYSHALYNITVLGQDPVDYFSTYVHSLTEGWSITQSLTVPNTETTIAEDVVLYKMKVPLSRLVLGLGNGWTYNSGKFLFLESEQIQRVYRALEVANMLPRGWMFWDIADEGISVGMESKPFYMTKTLNEVMNIRPLASKEVEEMNKGDVSQPIE